LKGLNIKKLEILSKELFTINVYVIKKNPIKIRFKQICSN